jgi:hypothetical protein
MAVPISLERPLSQVAAIDTVAGNRVFFVNPLEWRAAPNGPSVILKAGIFNLLIGFVV